MATRRPSSVAVCVAAAVAAALVGPGVGRARAGTMSTVVLTSTLNVNNDDTIRDVQYIWNGPSTSPVIRLAGTRHALVEHVFITTATGASATAAIEVADGAGGASAMENQLGDIHVGVFGVPANIAYGIHVTGAAQSNAISNAYIIGVSTAAVSLDNTSAVGNNLRGLFTYDVPIALQSRAAATTTCLECGFLQSHDVDVELLNGSGLLIRGLYSELARRFARVYDGSLGGGLAVNGGYWQWNGSYASGPTIESLSQCCRTYVRLTDFMVTPLDGTNHGTVSGFTAAQKLFSNVAGVA